MVILENATIKDINKIITLAEQLKLENTELENKLAFYEKLKRETVKRDISEVIKNLEKIKETDAI